MTSFEKVIHSSLSNLLLKLVTLTLGIVSVPILIKNIGMEKNGLLLLAGTIMGYFSLLGLSVPTGTIKFVAQYKEKNDLLEVSKIINTSIFLFAFIGIISLAFTVLFVKFDGLSLFKISPENRTVAENVIYIAGFWALLSWPANILSNALCGLQRFTENNIAIGIGFIVSTSFVIIAAMAHARLEVIFFLQNIGALLTWSMQYVLLKKALPEWNLSPQFYSTKTLKMIFSFSLWLILPQIASLLVTQTDKIVLGIFLPISALTIYQIVTTPYQKLKMMQDIVMPILFAKLSKFDKNVDKKYIRDVCNRSGRYCNSMIAFLGAFGIIFSTPFIRLWVGEQYVQYAWISQMMCIFLLFQASNSVNYSAFVATGHVKNLSVIALLIGIVNVPIEIILVPIIGVAGVLVATIAATMLSVLLQYIYVFPLLGFKIRDHLGVALKGQFFILLAALSVLPLWKHIQSISSPFQLVLAATLLAIVVSVVGWIACIEKEHKDVLKSRFKSTFHFLSFSKA